MGEISAGSVEQAQGIAQISQAVAQRDAVTQQNAALVEEAAAASASLDTQAKSLTHAVAVFRLPSTAGVASATMDRPFSLAGARS
ncbi:Methyl-accepting chemotaxis protein III [compost metagenome]